MTEAVTTVVICEHSDGATSCSECVLYVERDYRPIYFDIIEVGELWP